MENDKKYRFGMTVFRVISPLAYRENECFETFAAGSEEKENYIFELCPVEASAAILNGNPVQIKRHENTIKVYTEKSLVPQITVANLFSVTEAAKLLPERREFVLHASYVFYKKSAILFCAPSGTGKSTQAEFWKNARGTVTVNEDRAIIYQKEGVYYAGGCWATGKAKTCRNISAPIHRIVLLEQGSENRIIELSPAEKFKRLIAQCTFDPDTEKQRDSIISCVLDLIAAVPVIGYACVNNISSVDELEKYL